MKAASLNHVYRLVWSKLQQAWVAVAETARAQGKSTVTGQNSESKAPAGSSALGVSFTSSTKWQLVVASAFAAAIMPLSTFADTNEIAGVIAGDLTVKDISNTHTQYIHTANMNIVDFYKFGVLKGHQLDVIMPDAGKALYRVIGDSRSEIMGTLNSNGTLLLINQNGILFGQGSEVNVGNIVASTMNITNEAFLQGKYDFSAGNILGTIENRGVIKAQNEGYIVLLGNTVDNSGTLVASNGSVVLGSAQQATLDFFGNGLVKVKLSGDALEATVKNSGLIQADGGLVQLASNARSSAINVTGIIEANKLVERDGMIRLEGGDNALVEVSGKLFAKSEQGAGGTIEVTGEKVALLDGALLDVSGKTGGGTILVGGDYQGSNDAVYNAKMTYVAKDAVINADATENGNGGKVIVWGTDYMHSHGVITARGGAESGNGGFIETSAHGSFAVTNAPDASATNGTSGTWLIDPIDLTINNNPNSEVYTSPMFSPTTGPASINWATIDAGLANGNVTVTTVGTVGAGTGNITINGVGNLVQGTGNTLTISAADSINVNANIRRTVQGDLTLSAAKNILIGNNVTLTGNSKLTLGANGGNITQTGGSVITADTLTGNASTSASLTGNNRINNLGTFITHGAFTLNDTTGGLNVTGAINSGSGAISITTAGGALALGNNNVMSTGSGVTLKGVGVTSAAGSLILGAGEILVDGKGSAINLAGDLTTTSTSAKAVTVRNASTIALGNVTTDVRGTTVIGVAGDVKGAVTQTGIINTGTLTGSTLNSVNLSGNNRIGNLGAFTAGGNLTVNDSLAGLNVTGQVASVAGDVKVTTTGGNLTLTNSGSVSGVNVSLTTASANDVILAGNIVSVNDTTITSGRSIEHNAGNLVGKEVKLIAQQDITNNSTLTNVGLGSYTLQANNNINLKADINSGSLGKINLTADADSSLAGDILMAGNINAGSGGITMSALNVNRTAGDISTTNSIIPGIGGNVDITALGDVNLGGASINTMGTKVIGQSGARGGDVTIIARSLNMAGEINTSGAAAGDFTVPFLGIKFTTGAGGQGGDVIISTVNNASIGNITTKSGDAGADSITSVRSGEVNIGSMLGSIDTGNIDTSGGINNFGASVVVAATTGSITVQDINTSAGAGRNNMDGKSAGDVTVMANANLDVKNIEASGAAGNGVDKSGGKAGEILLVASRGNLSMGSVTTLSGAATGQGTAGQTAKVAVKAGRDANDLDLVTDISLNGNITVKGDIKTDSTAADAVQIVAEGNFDNSADISITTGFDNATNTKGNWTIYSYNPVNDNKGTKLSATTLLNTYDYKQYGTKFGDTLLGSGNGFVHAKSPEVVVILSGTSTKVVDGNNVVTDLSGLNVQVSGLIDGDKLKSPVILNGATFDTPAVGTGKPISGSYTLNFETAEGKNIYHPGATGNPVTNGSVIDGYAVAETTATGSITALAIVSPRDDAGLGGLISNNPALNTMNIVSLNPAAGDEEDPDAVACPVNTDSFGSTPILNSGVKLPDGVSSNCI